MESGTEECGTGLPDALDSSSESDMLKGISCGYDLDLFTCKLLDNLKPVKLYLLLIFFDEHIGYDMDLEKINIKTLKDYFNLKDEVLDKNFEDVIEKKKVLQE